VALGGIGEAYRRLGRLDEAVTYFQRSIAIVEKALGADDSDLMIPLRGLGLIQLARGAPPRSLPFLERALSLANDNSRWAPVEVADTQFAAAQALWQAGERVRAEAAARSARDSYASAGSRQAEVVAAWLNRAGVH
jgi:serine/threonine-protein kinase